MNTLSSNRLCSMALVACMIVSPMLGIAANDAVAGHVGESDASPTKVSAEGKHSIEGIWVSRAVNNANNPPTTFYTLQSYLPGGHSIEEASGSLIRTVGQGQWVRLGPREYMRTMYIMTFTTPRIFSGIQKVTSLVELTEDGDEYNSKALVEIYDVNGNLTLTVHNTGHGRRCTMEMTVPECWGFVD